MNNISAPITINGNALLRAIAAVQALQATTTPAQRHEVDVWLGALIELRNRLAHGQIEMPPAGSAAGRAAAFLIKIELSSLGEAHTVDWRDSASDDLIDAVIRLAPPLTTAESEEPAPTPDRHLPAVDIDVMAGMLTETYTEHYASLLRLAAMLLDDIGACEDVVQEAFIRVHSARDRVREPDKLLAYLRQTVVNLSRSTLRRRLIGLRMAPKPLPDGPSAEEGAYDALERDALVQALRGLQRRQREVLVLRYYSDLTEAQVAAALGVSIGSVRAYGSRGIEALRKKMEAHR